MQAKQEGSKRLQEQASLIEDQHKVREEELLTQLRSQQLELDKLRVSGLPGPASGMTRCWVVTATSAELRAQGLHCLRACSQCRCCTVNAHALGPCGLLESTMLYGSRLQTAMVL